MESFVLSVDLVKAYDTANHQLMYDILARYRQPPLYLSQKNYTDCKVEIQEGKSKNWIRDISGVHQGDNMPFIIFIYIIRAFIDPSPKQPKFRFFPDNKNGNLQTQNGRLLNQPTNSKEQTFNLDKTFYVDNSFFLFDSIEDLRKVTP
jgi:hypothetical protein